MSRYNRPCRLLSTENPTIGGPQRSAFLTFLEGRGYASGTIQKYLSSIIHFESWRKSRPKLRIPDLRRDVAFFVNQHLTEYECPGFSQSKNNARAALKHWLHVLDPTAYEENPSDNAQLVKSYDQYMADVAGLSTSTRHYRCRHALSFLDWLNKHAIELRQLSVKHLSDYITVLSKTAEIAHKPTSLKFFISFLMGRGDCSTVWLPAFLRPKYIHKLLSTQALEDDELRRLLQAFDLTSPVGKRDYAMARCLVDLGVRTSDVARLNLDQLDWRRGTLTLTPGKTKRARTLPMPVTTANALIDYIHSARPITPARNVFVYHRAPLGEGVLASTVRCALRRAFKRAGFKESESQVHRLRHTMATRLLQQGNSLKTIADVLGHLSVNTTTRYTHVDRPMLTAVAMPWAGGSK